MLYNPCDSYLFCATLISKMTKFIYFYYNVLSGLLSSLCWLHKMNWCLLAFLFLFRFLCKIGLISCLNAWCNFYTKLLQLDVESFWVGVERFLIMVSISLKTKLFCSISDKQYLKHTYTKKLSVVYLKFRFNHILYF